MKNLLKHPKLYIAISIVITVLFAIPLKNIRIESSIRSFFPQKHEAFTRLTKTEDEFGSMIAIGVSLESPGDTILTPQYIETIRKITDDLEQVENTSDVTSITNIDYIVGDNGTIEVAPLLQKNNDSELYEPVTLEDIGTITKRLADWEDMYDLVVISKDGRGTQISLTVNPKASLAEQDKALKTVRKIVKDNLEIDKSDLMVKFYGQPVISEESKAFMLSDLAGLIPLVILVVLISLFFSFRTADGTILPLITVLMATVWSVGLMSLLGFEFSIVSSVIPVALIACGSAYGIHVLTHYYIAVDEKRKELDASGQSFTKEIHIECIEKGFANVRLAVLLSAVTTVVGFISLITSPLRPLFGFAIFTGLGICYSLLLSCTIIPCFLSLKKIEKVGLRSRRMEKLTEKVKKRLSKIEFSKLKKGDAAERPGMDTTLYNIFHLLCGTKPRMAVFSLVIIVFSALGLSKIVIDTSMVNYFPESSRLRQDINYVNDNFAGTNSIFLLIKSPATKFKEEAVALFDQAQAIEDKAAAAGKELTAEEKAKVEDLRNQAIDKMAESRSAPDMTNPEALKAVDEMEKWICDKYDNVGKAVSYTDSIKRINQTWNAPGANASDSGYHVDYNSSSVFEDDLGLDDFGDFGDFGTEDVFIDDLGDFGIKESAAADHETYPDPNEQYQKLLSGQMSGKEIQELIDKSYALSGGRRASLEDFVRTFQKEMNYNGIAFYEIPYDPAKYMKSTRDSLGGVISNYTQMLGDSLERFTDDQTNYTPTMIRVQVQIKTNSTKVVGKMIDAFDEYANMHLPEGYYMEVTGEGEMEYVMTNMVIGSQVSSLCLSLLLVFIIIALSFKSPVAGIIGAIPLAFTIILNYMVMGITGIKLDLFTSIIASVAIGIGIDYTIHFMTEYKALRQNCTNIEQVTRETFRSSGIGIVTNALAVGLGFLVLCLSKFIVLRYIGILVAIVMFTSSGLAMTILPAIFNHFDPDFLHKGKPKAWESEENE